MGETVAVNNRTTHSHHSHHTLVDSLFRYAEFLKFGELHVKFDEATGLTAIIAIHNLKLGPALGGCRLYAYKTADKAIEDALRLAHMMSFKAAANHLKHGGAKAVLIKPKNFKELDHDAYFEKFGEFVDSLNGRYITAVDSGTNPQDMDIIARRTPYVSCTTALGGDPSPQTAVGVRRGIEAAVQFKLGKASVEGVHIAIQGAGHVGYSLAKQLAERGARLTMCDVNTDALQHCVDELGVAICLPDAIYDLNADVFAPCALGAVLNYDHIHRLRVPIVAGSANNQLSHRHYGDLLHERGILYAPDFVINAGGLIQATALYDHGDMKKSEQQINGIYDTLLEIFERAAKENHSTNEIAEKIALQRLG